MLATLMIPDGGRASIDGHDVVRDRYAVRRSIGVLSDARGLYPRLTARENIRYYGALHGLAGSSLDARVDELVRALGIAAIADRRAQGFSQGERMKVAIARALVHDPQTILLDEPTNGLDIMSIRALRDLLRELRKSGKCLLFSSHVMQEVSALCDSIVIVGRGRVVATGTAAELVAQSGEAVLEDAFVRCWVPAKVSRRDDHRPHRLGVGPHRGGREKGNRRHRPRSPDHAGDARDGHRRRPRVDAARAEPDRAPDRQGAGTDAARGRDRTRARAEGVPGTPATHADAGAGGLRGEDKERRPRRRARDRRGIRRRRRGRAGRGRSGSPTTGRATAHAHPSPRSKACCARSIENGDAVACCCEASPRRSRIPSISSRATSPRRRARARSCSSSSRSTDCLPR